MRARASRYDASGIASITLPRRRSRSPSDVDDVRVAVAGDTVVPTAYQEPLPVSKPA